MRKSIGLGENNIGDKNMEENKFCPYCPMCVIVAAGSFIEESFNRGWLYTHEILLSRFGK